MANRKNEVLTTFFLLLSHLAGLVRTLLVSYLYGSSRIADLISFSFSYPNQARKKMEEGTGNLALLRRLGEEREKGSVSLFILSFHIIALVVVLLFSDTLSSFIFRFTQFREDEAELGKRFFKAFLVFLTLFSYAMNLNSYMQMKGRKSLSAALSSIPSLISIVILAFFEEKLGPYAFSLGLLAGAVVYLLISLFYAFDSGMRFSISLRFDRPFVKSYLLSFLLILISVFEIIPLFLSSANTEKGSIYFTNAYAVLMLPYGFLMELFTVICYPELSRARKEEEAGKREKALLLVSFLSLSIFLLLFSFSAEISVFLFEKGLYERQDALETAHLLRLAAPSIYFLSLFSFFQRMMFLNLENRKILILSSLKIAVAYLMLILLDDGMEKSAMILLISSAFPFILSIASMRNAKKNLKMIGLSMIAAIPLMILGIIKRRLDLSAFITAKIFLLLSSLALGLLCFALSLLIYLKIIKGPGIFPRNLK